MSDYPKKIKTVFRQGSDGAIQKKKVTKAPNDAAGNTIKTADGGASPVAHRTTSDVNKANDAYKKAQGSLAHLVRKPKTTAESINVDEVENLEIENNDDAIEQDSDGDENVEFSPEEIESLERIDAMLDGVANEEPATFASALEDELQARMNLAIDAIRNQIASEVGIESADDEDDNTDLQGDAGDEDPSSSAEENDQEEEEESQNQ